MLGTASQRFKERFAGQYAEKGKEVKRSCRKGRRQYFETLVSKTEEAALPTQNLSSSLTNILKK